MQIILLVYFLINLNLNLSYCYLHQSKTYSTFIRDLSNCIVCGSTFHCPGVHISKRTDELMCETQLLLPQLTHLCELGYANRKLNEFNETVTDQLNKPFIIRHTKWYTIILSVIGAILFIVIWLNYCHWCGCLKFLRRIFCFTKNPHNGDTIPPIIKNFVNRNFNSDMYLEHNSHSQELVPYNRNQSITQEISTIQEEEEIEIPQSA